MKQERQHYMTGQSLFMDKQAEDRINWLRAEVWAFEHSDNYIGRHEIGIALYTSLNTPEGKTEYHFRGTLNELIELVLLGKLHKRQLQAIDKKEPVAEQPVPQAGL